MIPSLLSRLLRFTGLGAMCAVSSLAAVKETIVEYKIGDLTCEGVHVVDDALAGKLPSVLIIHQWTGVSENEKMRARMLAELGYNVFIADIYGKGIRPQPPEAGKEAGKYKSDRKLYRERLLAGLEQLRKTPQADPLQLAAIGYCFGGTGVIELARSGAMVKGVVSFHGGLDSPTPADGKNIKGKVLALHGAEDPFVPVKDVAAWEQEMKDAGVDYKLVQYPGAVHAFTQKGAGNDNSKGAAYNEAADKASWEEMRQFFDRLFKSKG
ncbi:MAG: dienelactone hydrolase family protein [Verrucomicrobiaceae bacterium]|jgi:dienelactone hydrolase|nr:dienelactone hydrolase family protein [Verrucomicrobiaceae bacterium]